MTSAEDCENEINCGSWKDSKDIDGVFLPRKFLDIQDEVSNWRVNDDDVWVVSFPKTGTTWTQEMVWLISNDLNYKGAQTNLLKRFPQLEASALVPYNKNILARAIVPAPIKDSLNYTRSLKSPVCIKTHLPWKMLPVEIQKDIKKPKIIYISRNPKDTCVSYYHFSKLVKDFVGTLEEFANLFLAGKVNFAPYWDHVLPFWKRRNQSNILFLKYEDMKQDLPSVIAQVANFLEKKISEEQIEKLAQHLSFESMKKNSAVNYDWLVRMSYPFFPDKNTSFMRKGIVGGYKTEMTPEIVERFDKWTKEHTKDTDLDF